MSKLWNDIVAILSEPFVGELDITHLFLLVGLVLIFLIAWAFVLEHVRMAAEAV